MSCLDSDNNVERAARAKPKRISGRAKSKSETVPVKSRSRSKATKSPQKSIGSQRGIKMKSAEDCASQEGAVSQRSKNKVFQIKKQVGKAKERSKSGS